MARNPASLDNGTAMKSAKRHLSIRNWWGEIENRSWKAIFFAAILLLGVYYAWFFPWGRWPPYGAAWSDWNTEPTRGANFDVLTSLLVQNREEVRFWQGVLFNVSLVFTAGVFGIVSFALKMRAPRREAESLHTSHPNHLEWLRWTYAIAVVFLAAFYLIFVKVAENAIALNHHDLTGIEIALKLAKESEYIQGQAIYDHRKENQKAGKGEHLIKQLAPFGISLTVLSVFAVLFLPVPPQPIGLTNYTPSD